jgi:transglutaminase-like putative cysteine protease
VSLCHNIARLLPRSTTNQQCNKSSIVILPEPDIRNEYEDFFGNKLLYFAIEQEHKKLSVTVLSEIEKQANGLTTIEKQSSLTWETVKKQLSQTISEHFDVRQYIPETAMTEATAEILHYTLQSFTPGRSIAEAARDLTARIYKDFTFKPGFTTVATPVAEVMKLRKGVCQDFAHLAIACIRSVGLAARYMSGYIETIPPPGVVKLVGVDASHAWFAVYDTVAGWLEFDPTNNLVPGAQHITVAWGRDYVDIAPLTGLISSSSSHELKVSVDVRRTG